jgi:hypothetical protein
MAPFLLVLFLSLFGWSIYGLVRARRSHAEALRIARRMSEARRTSIQDAPETCLVIITGKASSAAPDLVTPPFSGGDALWARAWLQTDVGDLITEWIRQVDEIMVDDGSGRIARVDLGSVRVRLPGQEVAGSENAERIERYLAYVGHRRGKSTGFEYESVLRPNDTVSVMGRVGLPKGGYRTGSNVLRFSQGEEVLLFDAGEEPRAREISGRLMGCAVFGIVFSALAALITLLTMLEG